MQSLQPPNSSVHYIISGVAQHIHRLKSIQITKFAKGTTGLLLAGAPEPALKLYDINKQGQVLYK